MSYYTTVKTVNKNGEPIKAEVICGGKSRGFTNLKTGEISFELSSKTSYRISAKRSGEKASGTLVGGQSITLRLS